jgi:hypothetical protein
MARASTMVGGADDHAGAVSVLLGTVRWPTRLPIWADILALERFNVQLVGYRSNT